MARLPTCMGAALLVMTGCAESSMPLEVQASASAATVLEGSYELPARQHVAGAELYEVSVHFGRGPAADGRTVLAEVGVSRGGSSSLAMQQRSYTVHADTVLFGGTLLERGVLSADGRELRTAVRVDGVRVSVTLARR